MQIWYSKKALQDRLMSQSLNLLCHSLNNKVKQNGLGLGMNAQGILWPR